MDLYKKIVNFKSILFKNFLSLSSIQMLNYLIPLATFPYILRILHADKFGLIVFSQAFIQFFVLFTDYGFNLSATQSISVNRDDAKKVSRIFSSVMSIKVFLMFVTFLVLLAIIFTFDKFSSEKVLYLITFSAVLGSVLFPVWLYQGLEQMRAIPFIQFIPRLISGVLLFVFVKKSGDYIAVALLYSASAIVTGIAGIIYGAVKFRIHFGYPASLTSGSSSRRDGTHLCL